MAGAFYTMRCEHCGWTGSTEHALEDRCEDDADVICPKCHRVTLAEECRPTDKGEEKE